MTESKHTPGPWRLVVGGNFTNVVEGPSGRQLYDGDDGYRPVAMFQSCCASRLHADEEANAAANGALIAAAPELLEALRYAIDSLEYVDKAHPDQVTGYGVRAERIAAARALLAKLEGEKP